MYVGILEVQIKLDEAFTLKDKRQVIKSVFERVKKRHNFSTGEVRDLSLINLSSWGFVCVSNSYSHTEERLNKLEEFLQMDFRFEIIEVRREIINDIN
ncbi:MAG: DUF503 domain-containing protein [Tissierellia bacterium]|nr:DUF503 domain-containing protein [Tissierellia bacterium]